MTLSLETGPQHVLGQPGQQPIGADQFDTIVLCSFDEFLCELLVLRWPSLGFVEGAPDRPLEPVTINAVEATESQAVL